MVTVNPSLYTKLDFNPQKDFAPDSIIAALPNSLVVHPTLPVKSVAELIGLAKSKSGHLTFASGGIYIAEAVRQMNAVENIQKPS